MIAIAITTTNQPAELQMVSCSTCPYFHRTTSENPDVTEPEGECRCSLPQMGMRSEKRWPEVSGDEWCGAHPDFDRHGHDDADVADKNTTGNDITDGLLELPDEPPAEEINGGVPKNDDPNRPLEPLDVVLMDDLQGARGVTGIVTRANDPTSIEVNIGGQSYTIDRRFVTRRLCRVGPAKI